MRCTRVATNIAMRVGAAYLRKLTKVLRKHIAFIVLFTLIVEILLGAAVFFLFPDRYDSTATLMVSRTDGNLSSDNFELDSQLLTTYRSLCTNDNVLIAAMQRSGVGLTTDELRQRVRVTNPDGTSLINIVVWSSDSEQSARLANALSQALIESVHANLKIENLQIIDEAKPAVSPSRGSYFMILGIGLAAALVIAVLFICIKEYYDDTLRSTEQVAELFGKPVIGQIPHGVTRLRRR